MSTIDAIVLIGGGFAAGIVNTLAGGGSLLTVPLLVVLGLPGTLANGTNRVGILVQNTVSAWRFREEGVSGFRDAVPVLVPVALGSAAGAFLVSRLDSKVFERAFGIVMVVLLVFMLVKPGSGSKASGRERDATPWPLPVRWLAFAGIGIYGGAFQAGVGLPLLLALSRSGFDLVRANSVKAVVIAVFSAVAVPIFVMAKQVEWLYAALLAVGFAAGGAAGARIAVAGGERIIRPVLVVSVLALAGRMLGLY